MGKWSPEEKTVLGVLLYIGGFTVALGGASLLCFQRRIFELTGLFIPTPVAIVITIGGAALTIVGDFMRRACRKK